MLLRTKITNQLLSLSLPNMVDVTLFVGDKSKALKAAIPAAAWSSLNFRILPLLRHF